MLCSRCTEVVKPVVALDIDGTLGNYHSHFYNFMIGYSGFNPSRVEPAESYQGDIPFGEFISDVFDVTLDEFRAAKLAYRQGGLKRTMPAFLDAASMAMALHGECELWVTTTRPYLRIDNIDPDTRVWLFRNRIPYHVLLFHNDKYQVLAERVDQRRVVAIVDDLKENLDPAASVFGEHIPIQYATPYNRAARFTPFESNHLEIAKTIKRRIDMWTEAVHGQ